MVKEVFSPNNCNIRTSLKKFMQITILLAPFYKVPRVQPEYKPDRFPHPHTHRHKHSPLGSHLAKKWKWVLNSQESFYHLLFPVRLILHSSSPFPQIPQNKILKRHKTKEEKERKSSSLERIHQNKEKVPWELISWYTQKLVLVLSVSRAQSWSL